MCQAISAGKDGNWLHSVSSCFSDLYDQEGAILSVYIEKKQYYQMFASWCE